MMMPTGGLFNRLVFVDCEAIGASPVVGQLTEFGAVAYVSRRTFHGILIETRPSKGNPAIPEIAFGGVRRGPKEVFTEFDAWLAAEIQGHPIFVSDNPAFDWQWINAGFWQHLGRNRFGFSARRIGDFYAGLIGDFTEHNAWKSLRVTVHDHNPVHDAAGNAEAFERLIKGERLNGR